MPGSRFQKHINRHGVVTDICFHHPGVIFELKLFNSLQLFTLKRLDLLQFLFSQRSIEMRPRPAVTPAKSAWPVWRTSYSDSELHQAGDFGLAYFGDTGKQLQVCTFAL